MSTIATQQVVEGYQILFRSIADSMKEEAGGNMTMKQVKPYLLNFEEDKIKEPISVFPSVVVRNLYIDTAFLLFNKAQYEEATLAFCFLKEVIADDPNVVFGYGSCLFMAGRHEEAEELFSQAEALMPSYVQATILRIRSYMESGKKQAAQSALYSAFDDAERSSDSERKQLLLLVAQHFRLQVAH